MEPKIEGTSELVRGISAIINAASFIEDWISIEKKKKKLCRRIFCFFTRGIIVLFAKIFLDKLVRFWRKLL